MKALKPINAGEEIFNDYGPLPRSDLLRRYGYITDNYAQYDVVEIPFSHIAYAASGGVPSYDEKIKYLDEHDLVESGYDICASDPFTIYESISPELIMVIETLILEADDFERLKRKGKLPKPEHLTAKGARIIHGLIQSRMSEYTIASNQDIQDASSILLTRQMSQKERRYTMAKIVRMGEIKILRQAEEALITFFQEKERSGGVSKRQAEEESQSSGKKKRAN